MQGLRLYGHRGAPTEFPENTLGSFACAQDIGVEVLETDVHLSRDGHAVVAHDGDGLRAAGVNKEIRNCSLTEIQSWDVGWQFINENEERPYAGQGYRMPTLGEALEAFPTLRFNIDIKQRQPSMVKPLLRLLREHEAEARVTLASFHSDVIRDVRALQFRGETALGRDELIALACLPSGVHRRLPLSRGNAVQVPLAAGPFRFASEGFIKKCHALDLRVDFWTVNDPIVAEVLLDRGADGIMTDDPRAIQPVFARYRKR